MLGSSSELDNNEMADDRFEKYLCLDERANQAVVTPGRSTINETD